MTIVAAFPACAALKMTTVSEATRPSSSTYGAEQISGITWAGGDLYYAVDDNDKKLYPITLNINRDTGSLASGTNGITIGTGVVMAGANDMEGCAFDPASGKVWIAQETNALIREFDPAVDEPFAITGIRILDDEAGVVQTIWTSDWPVDETHGFCRVEVDSRR